MLQPKKSFSFKIYGLLLAILLLAIGVTVIAIKNKKSDSIAATTFSQPRPVKPFQLTTPTKTFSEKNLIGHWTLLFFGYTYCSDVCPATLTVLNKVYQELHFHYPSLQVVFVSVDETDKTAVSQYAVSFNKEFIGAYGTKAALKNIQQQFGIFVERDMNANIQHSTPVVLINPQGQWIALFSYGTPASQISLAFRKIAGT